MILLRRAYNEKKNEKVQTIGILGGMGPEATLYLFQLIIKTTPAERDQDHIPVVIYSNPKIPDRTESILQGKHEHIIEELQSSAKLLQNAGVDFIVIPCNTVHYYLEDIQREIDIPILDMIEITTQYLHERIMLQEDKKNNARTGLLATTGTIVSGIYQKRFQRRDMELITPSKSIQKEVMEIIYGIKKYGPADSYRKRIIEIINHLKDTEEVNWIILGCTELPLLFQTDSDIDTSNNFSNILIDPMDILSKFIVQKIILEDKTSSD
ncbi:MAG: aspartate/glutamate racemase family protein [Promethearchaeota archaeon]